VRFRNLVLFVTLLTCALLVPSSALGGGDFQSGKYKGTTEQGYPIVFKATQGQVAKLRVETVAICESGKGSKGKFFNLHAPIRNSRFEIEVDGAGGATHLTLKGRLAGPFAGGTIVDRTRVNPEKEGKPEPTGSDRCKATFHWAAEIP
jgi:hypothetical protein